MATSGAKATPANWAPAIRLPPAARKERVCVIGLVGGGGGGIRRGANGVTKRDEWQFLIEIAVGRMLELSFLIKWIGSN